MLTVKSWLGRVRAVGVSLPSPRGTAKNPSSSATQQIVATSMDLEITDAGIITLDIVVADSVVL